MRATSGYDAASTPCVEAWAEFAALGGFDVLGNFVPNAVGPTRLLIRGQYLRNPNTIDALTADGRNINQWAKMATARFETSHGPAEVHFYQRLDTGVLNLTTDFKLVFKEIPG